jgi:hypothetical protein
VGRGFESLLDHQRNVIAVRVLALTVIFFITLKEMQGYGASIVFYTCIILASGI